MRRAVLPAFAALAALGPAVALPGAPRPAMAAYALRAPDCAAPAQTIATDSTATLTIAPGTALALTGGTFAGGVDAFPAGATLCVAPAAIFRPAFVNLGAGRVVNHGTAILPRFASGGGATLDNDGVAAFPAGLDAGLDAIVNRAGGSVTVDRQAAIGEDGLLVNQGSLVVNGALTTGPGAELHNGGQVEIHGDAGLRGAATNTGTLTATGTLDIAAGLRNTCRVTAAALTNRAASTNSGVIAVVGAFTNHDVFDQAPAGDTVGGSFVNDGTVRGNGGYLFTGSTTSTATVHGASPLDPIVFQDVTPTAGQLLDVQTGAVGNVVAGTVTPPGPAVRLEGCGAGAAPPADLPAGVRRANPAAAAASAAPRVADDSRVTGLSTPVSGAVTLTGAGHPVTAALNTAPQHGTAAVTPDGGYSYLPAPGYAGADAFTVVGCDTVTQFCGLGRVSITVSATPPPPSPSAAVAIGGAGGGDGLRLAGVSIEPWFALPAAGLLIGAGLLLIALSARRRAR